MILLRHSISLNYTTTYLYVYSFPEYRPTPINCGEIEGTWLGWDIVEIKNEEEIEEEQVKVDWLRSLFN